MGAGVINGCQSGPVTCHWSVCTLQTCFEWFTKGVSDLEQDTQLQLFQKELLKVDPGKLSRKGECIVSMRNLTEFLECFSIQKNDFCVILSLNKLIRIWFWKKKFFILTKVAFVHRNYECQVLLLVWNILYKYRYRLFIVIYNNQPQSLSILVRIRIYCKSEGLIRVVQQLMA